MKKQSIAVMVLIETDDPRLDPSTINVNTTKATATLRQAVIDNLPSLTRVVAVMPEENARLMMSTHDLLSEAVGHPAHRPPRRYVPPTRE